MADYASIFLAFHLQEAHWFLLNHSIEGKNVALLTWLMEPSIYEFAPLQLLSLNADDGGNIDKKSARCAHRTLQAEWIFFSSMPGV